LGGGFQGDGQEERLFDVVPLPPPIYTHPSNDFSLYDHVLDTSVMVGAIPEMAGAGLLFCHGAPQKIITAHLMERVDMT
jgi:hypothetical protein